MKRVLILVEGQTEESFINRILAPCYQEKDIFIRSTCICTKRVKSRREFRGGHGKRYSLIKRDLVRLLNDKDAFVTTMIDYYGLPDDFPGRNEIPGRDCYKNVSHLEKRFAEDINSRRFLPNIILHEYEGLLFSNPEAIAEVIGERDKLDDLLKIGNSFSSPEEINDSADTAPSKRIEKIFRIYRKTTHGPLIARRIGLERIKEKCSHFNEWLNKIEKL